MDKPHAPKHGHDRSYRRLFSKPRLVEELIRGFFDEPWVERLDFTTLEPADGSFVGKNLRAREVDLIWKLRTKKGRPVYVYLLLELQSTVDRYMAVRMMSGTAALVISIVVYNGAGRTMASCGARSPRGCSSSGCRGKGSPKMTSPRSWDWRSFAPCCKARSGS